VEFYPVQFKSLLPGPVLYSRQSARKLRLKSLWFLRTLL